VFAVGVGGLWKVLFPNDKGSAGADLDFGGWDFGSD
jgi:hypothetical protein